MWRKWKALGDRSRLDKDGLKNCYWPSRTWRRPRYGAMESAVEITEAIVPAEAETFLAVTYLLKPL